MRTMALGALVLAGAWFSSCAASPPRHTSIGFAVSPPPALPAPAFDSVILVAIDGARWQEVFRGVDPAFASAADLAAGSPEELMPTLHRWMTVDGVGLGAPGHAELRASGPNYVSMPGYTEMLTGRRSACQSNECGATEDPTLVDEILGAGDNALVVSSWERIALVATKNRAAVPMSAGRHAMGAPGELDERDLAAGRASGPWPGSDDYRPDALTMRVALGALDRGLPTFAFVGLGDTDEHAHHGDYHAYLAALRAADDFLALLEARATERTAIFVTADHGRCATFRDHGGCPESARDFLAVRAPALALRGFVGSRAARLADLAPTIRCMLGLRADRAPDAGRPIEALCPR